MGIVRLKGMKTDDSPHTYQIVFKDGVILVLEYFGEEGLEALVMPPFHNVKFTKGQASGPPEVPKPKYERFKTWVALKMFPFLWD